MNIFFKRILSILLFSVVITIHASSSDNVKRYLVIEEDSISIRITCLENNIIHVQSVPIRSVMKKSMVVDEDQFVFSDYMITKNTLETNILKVVYSEEQKIITFLDKQTGRIILSESACKFEPIEVLGDKAYSISQTFKMSENEGIYGLGQFQEGILNYRGKEAYLVHANRDIANPVLLSTNNYVLFWDNYSKTLFSDNETGATFWSEMEDGVSYYFVYGTDMKNAVSEFRHLTGYAPMLPKSAFGFWVSRERYKSFDELTGVVAEYRKRNIPMDNIVQDWQYWGGSPKHELWNNMKFSPENFADPEKVINDLHNKYNVKLTLSVWPCAGKETKLYHEMDSVKALFDIPTWAGYKVIDIYNPSAQKIYWDNLYEGLFTKGVDSWWMDATEPSFRDGLYQNKQEEWSKKAGMTYIGPFHRYMNTYSLVLSQVMYENLRKQNNKRVSILTRSAFAGQQKYGTSTWSGDIYASWNVLKKQIPAGLNLCMTGIPYWTTDIGAFRVKSQEKANSGGTGELGNYVDESKMSNDGGYKEGLKDPAYLELYTRWFQYGAFNPMFRIHGTEVPREIWYFGEPGNPYYDAQVEMINLRYSLLSYIYSTSWQVTSNGATMMRALVMDFTNDKNVYNNSEAYMFGDALLVNPIVHPMFHDRDGKILDGNTKVSIYLPKHDGKYWYDFNSDKVYQGGNTIDYNAPLNIIPVFVKAGSIVPRNEPVQYVGADDNSEMDIVVYSGENAIFTLYEDDNETYDYEKRGYTTIDISWDEMGKELIFSAPNGNKKPLAKRIFNVKIIGIDGNNTKIAFERVLYKNKEIRLKF